MPRPNVTFDSLKEPGLSGGSTPRYRQIAHHLGDLIQRGTYAPGDRLPSIRKLSRQLGVSITTIQAAYDLLTLQGSVVPQPQRGYFIGDISKNSSSLIDDGICRQAVAVSSRDVSFRGQIIANAESLRYGALGAALPDPSLLPEERLGQILRQISRNEPHLTTSYNVSAGDARLRQAVAQRFHFGGALVAPDEILITNGATEALSLALSAICAPGDIVAVESPTYFNYLQLLKQLDLQVLEIPNDPQSGLSVSSLAIAMSEHPVKAVLCVPTFHNPTGSCMSPEDKQRLVSLCSENKIPLVEDDVYGELHFSAQRPPLLKSYDSTGTVLTCSSISKTLAPGLRVGWLVAGPWFQRCHQEKATRSLGSPMLPQRIIGQFLASGEFDRHLRRLRPELEGRIDSLLSQVRHLFPKDTRCIRPQGGMTVWIELPPEFDVMRFHQAAVDAGIGIVPGPVFSIHDRYRHHLRLNAACWNESLEPVLATLARLLSRCSAVR
jgi:DNA-binding transcriptional MocR family regulator